MKRIGILGGTFNPIHIGHLTVAQMAAEKMGLDKVIFIPSNLPPHKSGKNVASARNRYQMIKLAIKGNSSFSVSDFEIKKPGKSYSIDTVEHLRQCYPRGTKFYFLIGSDLLPTLHKWKQTRKILKIASFVSVNRPGFKSKAPRIKVKSINIPGLQTSSSFVRQRITSGKTVRYLVPDSVLDYIQRKKLYTRQYRRKEK